MASLQCAFDCDSEEVCCVQLKLALLDLIPVLNYYFYNIPRTMRYAVHVARNGGEERRIQGFCGET